MGTLRAATDNEDLDAAVEAATQLGDLLTFFKPAD